MTTVSAIIQASVTVVMATVQMVYNEIQENRARKQWRHDQARQRALREEEIAQLQIDNDVLRTQIDDVLGTGGVGPAGSITGLAGSYVPYILLGVGGIVVASYLFRRKK